MAELRHAEDAGALRRAANALDRLSGNPMGLSREELLVRIADASQTVHEVAVSLDDSVRGVASELLELVKPITPAALGGRESIPVACPCGWDDDGELEVHDIRHPDGFDVRPPAGRSPLVLYGDEGQPWQGAECPRCQRILWARDCVRREAATA